MTREERLYTMTMACLVEVANKLGIKIDKKGAKSKAVAKILEAEAKKDAENPDNIPDTEYVEQVMEQKKELGIECPPIESIEVVSDDTCADGTTYAEVGKEIAEQAKEKSVKAKRATKPSAKKVDNSARRDALVADIEKLDGFSCKLYEKLPNLVVIKYNNKSVIEVRFSRTGTTINCKECYVPKNVKVDVVQNYYMPATLKLGLDCAKTLNNIINLIKA